MELYYIGERGNPQLNRPYYKLYGQLSKTEAKKKSECSYGTMILTSYSNVKDYNEAIAKLKEEGKSVH